MDEIQLIQQLSSANGVSGFEDEVVAICKNQLHDTCEITEDSLRNLIFSLKTNTGKPRIWLDAHMDEVGFMVSRLNPNGTLGFLPLGGWDPGVIPASKVRVQQLDGTYLAGIVATTPPHYLKQSEPADKPTIQNMVIDVGAITRGEHHIGLGAPIVPDVACTYDDERKLFLGKAFDCRIGVAALIETVKQASTLNLDVDIVGTLSAQEEVGIRGISSVAKTLEADIAIVFEGCPADDTFEHRDMAQTALYKGPMLRHFDRCMITNPRFMRHTINLAKSQNIPLQEAVRSGGGTSAAYIHTAKNGIPTIVIGVPVRYAHTHHGFTSLEDYQNTVKLAVAVLKSLNDEVIKSF